MPGVMIPSILLFKYALVAYVTPANFEASTWFDKMFFITWSMGAMGIITVLEWDALFPDRRDYAILTPLPLRMRTVFAAKLTALVGFLAIFSLDIVSISPGDVSAGGVAGAAEERGTDRRRPLRRGAFYGGAGGDGVHLPFPGGARRAAHGVARKPRLPPRLALRAVPHYVRAVQHVPVLSARRRHAVLALRGLFLGPHLSAGMVPGNLRGDARLHAADLRANWRRSACAR